MIGQQFGRFVQPDRAEREIPFGQYAHDSHPAIGKGRFEPKPEIFLPAPLHLRQGAQTIRRVRIFRKIPAREDQFVAAVQQGRGRCQPVGAERGRVESLGTIFQMGREGLPILLGAQMCVERRPLQPALHLEEAEQFLRPESGQGIIPGGQVARTGKFRPDPVVERQSETKGKHLLLAVVVVEKFSVTRQIAVFDEGGIVFL